MIRLTREGRVAARARVAARDLARALDLILVRDFDRDFALALGRVLILDRDRARVLVLAHVLDLVRARDVVLVLIRDLDRVRDVVHDLDPARALDVDLARIRAHALDRALVDLDLTTCSARIAVPGEARTRPGRVARGLVAVAVLVLPVTQRGRYRAEFLVELIDLPPRKRLGHGLRVLASSWELRGTLKEAIYAPDGEVTRQAER